MGGKTQKQIITVMTAVMNYRQVADQIIEWIIIYSQIFRKYPFCHSLPARSLHYNGRYCGLCARCTTMYLGGILTTLSFPLWNAKVTAAGGLMIGVLLITPAGIDGTTQMFTKRESNNKFRVATGFLLGIGIPLICWWGINTLLI